MAKKDEFDVDFDFEKEYGFDPNEFLDEEPAEEDDLFGFTPLAEEAPEETDNEEPEELVGDDFIASLGINLESEEDTPEEELEEDTNEEAPKEEVKEYRTPPKPAFEVEPELGEEFTAAFEKDFPSEEEEKPEFPAEEDKPEEKNVAETPMVPRRRRKLSKERIIKEVYLPPIIAGLALILVIWFVGGAIGRAVKNNRDEKEAIKASQEAVVGALQQEADALVAQANRLASGYDYDAALALLDTFSGDAVEYQNILNAVSTITQAKDQLQAIDNPASIPNLSFHCLIADPARAFTDETYGKSYNNNYVTIDEFSKILDQLYANGYVLVDFGSFVEETTGENGKVTYSTKPIFLPEGKKPIMLTETLVNYETFSIDSNGDGEADKGGDGFASKLVVQNGKIVNEYVTSAGETVYGAYDLVPILENFIEAHPDFCYQGARATLAVSGEDGIFGYRISSAAKTAKGEDYYNQQVEGAKAIAQALRDAGYTIACYTYANVDYGQISATKIQVDMDNWKKDIRPVLGQVDVLIYAKGSDISADNSKYNVLKGAGFTNFINASTVPFVEVTVNTIRSSRIMVTGSAMTTSPNTFSGYFNVSEVLNSQRGNN